MATLLVTYNLNGDDDDYADLFKVINRLGDTWHDAAKLDSVWFVKTPSTPAQVNAAMAEVMKDGDNRFVVDITGCPRSGWMPKSLWTWLSS